MTKPIRTESVHNKIELDSNAETISTGEVEHNTKASMDRSCAYEKPTTNRYSDTEEGMVEIIDKLTIQRPSEAINREATETYEGKQHHSSLDIHSSPASGQVTSAVVNLYTGHKTGSFKGDHRYPPVDPPIHALQVADRPAGASNTRISAPDAEAELAASLASGTALPVRDEASAKQALAFLMSPKSYDDTEFAAALAPSLVATDAPLQVPAGTFSLRDPEHEVTSCDIQSGQQSGMSGSFPRYLTNAQANARWGLLKNPQPPAGDESLPRQQPAKEGRTPFWGSSTTNSGRHGDVGRDWALTTSDRTSTTKGDVSFNDCRGIALFPRPSIIDTSVALVPPASHISASPAPPPPAPCVGSAMRSICRGRRPGAEDRGASLVAP